MEAIKLKTIVIKEELYAITGDTIESIILGQFIYWEERVTDYDLFIKEEIERNKVNGIECNINYSNGWIYKKASDLISECMLNISENTIRKYISNLIKKGFITSRNNPSYKWDRTTQYRVNMVNVIKTIKNIGYDGLSGWTLNNESTKLKNCVSKLENCGAIPEITTEITTDNKESTKVDKKENNSDEWKHDYDAYKQLVCNAADTLKLDAEFKSKQEMYFPNVNYELSIDKGCDYWLSEQGYKKCKQAKSKINMLSRLKNNFDKNRIYNSYGRKQQTSMFREEEINKDKLIINGTEYK